MRQAGIPSRQCWSNWNWKEVKGRRHKPQSKRQAEDGVGLAQELRAIFPSAKIHLGPPPTSDAQREQPPSPAAVDELEDEYEDVPSPAEPLRVAASEACAPKVEPGGHDELGSGASSLLLWRMREPIFKHPPEWEILVENTFISIDWRDRRSRTASAPARLITSPLRGNCVVSSSSHGRPGLPADLPPAPNHNAPVPPVLDASDELLGYMTLVKKRKGRRIQTSEDAGNGLSVGTVQRPLRQSSSANGVQEMDSDQELEDSMNSAEASRNRMELDLDSRTLSGMQAGESSEAGEHSGSSNTPQSAPDGGTSEYGIKSRGPEHLASPIACAELSEDAGGASTMLSQSSSSAKAESKRARKRAAKLAMKAREAVGNPQDPGKSADFPSPKSAVVAPSAKTVVLERHSINKDEQSVAQASPPQQLMASAGPAIKHAFHARYSLESFHRSAWPSRRTSRDRDERGYYSAGHSASQVVAPARSFILDEEEAWLEEEGLSEVEPEESAARLEKMKARLADVQANLQKARQEVHEQELGNIPADREILYEFEGVVREAETVVLREEENLKERRRQGQKKQVILDSSFRQHDLVFVDRGGAGKASPCQDLHDAVALVTQKLAQERALAGLSRSPDATLE